MQIDASDMKRDASRASLRPRRKRFTMIYGGRGSMMRLSHGSSLRGTMFNLINSMIGGGILSLPFAMEECGLVLGIALIIGVALMTDLAAWMLLYASDATRENSYAGVAEALYGRWLGVVVDITVFLNNLGSCMGYVVIIGDLLPSFMSFVDGPALLKDRAGMTIILGITVLFPLASLKSMSALSYVSLLCLCMIATFVVSLFVMGAGIIDVSEPYDGPPHLYPPDTTAMVAQVPVIFFAFICHQNIPILYGELRRQSFEEVDSKFRTKRGKMMYAMHVSVFVCAVVYLIGAVSGYVAFKGRTAHDVLVNLQYRTFFLAPYVKLAYSIVIICSYPIMSLSCASSFHRLLWLAKVVRPSSRADAIGGIDPMTLASPMDMRSPGPWADRTLMPQELHLQQPPVYERPAKEEVPPPQGILRLLEVAFIVGTTLLFAIAVPDVSIVFGLTGGVCCSSIMYIFPAMFYLRVKSDEAEDLASSDSFFVQYSHESAVDGLQHRGGKFLGHVLLWGGISVAIGSTTIIIMQTLGVA